MEKIRKKALAALLACCMVMGACMSMGAQKAKAADSYEVPVGYMDYKNTVEYGTVTDIQYYSNATDSTRKAKVILPAGYSDEKEYPVMYLIHGIGGNETSLYKDDNVQWTIGNAIAEGTAEDMIVVLPNACANKTGTPPADFYSLEHYAAYDNFLYDLTENLMPYMEEHYSVKTGRENTAIAGFSMGGRVTLHISFSRPDLFKYAGAFCPAPGILKCTHYGVAQPGLFTESSFTLPQEYMDQTYVQITAGTNDTIVEQFPKSYHDALEANGVPHTWYMTAGGDAQNPGNGDHNAPTYKHGLYNFMKMMKEMMDAEQEPDPDPEPAPEFPYVDVPEDMWCYDSVYANYLMGTMTGKDETHFAPDETLVRAQFATVLHNMNGAGKVTFEQKFPDVNEKDWFADAVLWAAETKVVKGYDSNGWFGPNDSITREQMAIMMYRYAKDYKGYEIVSDGDYTDFPDADKVNSGAADAVKWAVGNKIITGKTVNDVLMLDPQGTANRAECATIIQRFIEKYGK